MDLQKVLHFSKLLSDFGNVERVTFALGKDRRDNNVDHSYRLAMLAWYILEVNDIKHLNVGKVIMYALVHDLVEVYAGDTYIYTNDKKLLESKVAREEAAAKRIKDEFPEFDQIHSAIESYEMKEDEESKFVYALDKIEPIILIYNDGGRTWKEKGITIQMLIDMKKSKVAVSPEIKKYFEKLIELLYKEEKDLFAK